VDSELMADLIFFIVKRVNNRYNLISKKRNLKSIY